MQHSQVYCIGVNFQDLKQEQVIQEALISLKQLEDVTSDVFARIAKRVQEEKKRMNSLNERVAKCRAKVSAVAQRNNMATTVFSTSKFPSVQKIPNLYSLYHDRKYAEAPPLAPEPEDEPHYLPADPKTIGQYKQVTADIIDLFDKINPEHFEKNPETTMTEKGLGRLPPYVPTVGSVLLFNSGENPYQQYVSWDNLLGRDFEEEEEAKKELAPAPKTLVEGDQLPAVFGLNFDFHPQLKEHRNLSEQLPSNLPLKHIASEQNYQADPTTQVSIAPSLFQDGARLELPQIADFAFNEGPVASEPAGKKSESGSMAIDIAPPPPPPESYPRPPPPPPHPADGTQPPPPPPPPPPPLLSVELPPIDTPDSPAPPVLPPIGVPTDMPSTAPDGEEAREGGNQSEGASQPANSRMSLLDAIRNPSNLNRLKKAAERELEEEKEEAQAAPLSIADEIKQRMARRQAAISGKTGEQKSKPSAAPVLKPQVVTAPTSAAPPPATTKPSVALPDIGDSDDEGSEAGGRGGSDLMGQLRKAAETKERLKKQAEAAEKIKQEALPPPPPMMEAKPAEALQSTAPAFALQNLEVLEQARAQQEHLFSDEDDEEDWSD